MAELAGGLIGACASLAATAYARSSGFSGRHESSHRAELASLDGSASRFSVSLENGTATEDDEESFRVMWHDARQKNVEYYESINEYKDVSWIRLAIKLKLRKMVRKKKADVAGSFYSYSDNASVYATSGSPPGSALGKEFISEWRDRLHVAASWNDYNESLPNLHELTSPNTCQETEDNSFEQFRKDFDDDELLEGFLQLL
ncbi:hypothetical protein BDZ89DRAFT_1060664 [Hymenopellis radicata]|nr:hypothetical protein BDZ89DRAFT_1060664 [Hymenopellis radicata]